MIYDILNKADEWTNEGGVGYWLISHPGMIGCIALTILLVYIILVRVDENEHRRKNKNNEEANQEAKKVKYPSGK